MFLKTIWAVLILGRVFASDVEDSQHEIPCISYGGICLKEAECPEGSLAAVRGLCPQQQHLGVECCHSLSNLPSPCKSRGGECIPSEQCPERLVYKEAIDCKSNEKCCILIN